MWRLILRSTSRSVSSCENSPPCNTSTCRVQGVGFRVLGSGCGVQGVPKRDRVSSDAKCPLRRTSTYEERVTLLSYSRERAIVCLIEEAISAPT
jgi:hypothetical protein